MCARVPHAHACIAAQGFVTSFFESSGKNYLRPWSTVPFPFLFSLKYPVVFTKHSEVIIVGVEGSKICKGENSRAQLQMTEEIKFVQNIRVIFRAKLWRYCCILTFLSDVVVVM